MTSHWLVTVINPNGRATSVALPPIFNKRQSDQVGHSATCCVLPFNSY